MATITAPNYSGLLPRTVGVSRRRADFCYEVTSAGVFRLVLVTDRWVLRHPHPFAEIEAVREFAYRVFLTREYVYSQHWEALSPGQIIEVSLFE